MPPRINMPACPRRSPTTHTTVVGDEVCVYDWSCHRVHALSPTAAQVWQRCDGQTDTAEIAERLRGVRQMVGSLHRDVLWPPQWGSACVTGLWDGFHGSGIVSRHTPYDSRRPPRAQDAGGFRRAGGE
jgi:hypothetical protein